MKRVLLVDDDPEVRFVVARVIGHLGHECVEAERVGEGQKLIQDGEKFDLIVSDCEMPDGNGPQFAAWLREQGVTTPIALISGSVTIKIPPGVSDVVFQAKPFTLAELKALFQPFLG